MLEVIVGVIVVAAYAVPVGLAGARASSPTGEVVERVGRSAASSPDDDLARAAPRCCRRRPSSTRA